MELLIIADDFTGANDTGAHFAKNGISTDVLLHWQSSYTGHAQVVIVNTDSRAMTIENAQAKINQILNSVIPNKIYKKLDSTLRGNIGAELESCLMATECKLAIVCPAYPKVNRIIDQGICYVNGTPLLETEFATDPKTPIISSYVKDIIHAQTAIPVIAMNMVQTKLEEVKDEIAQLCQQNQKTIICFDACSENELKQIVALAQNLEEPLILAGSAGLAEYIEIPSKHHPILFVVASMSEITTKQTQWLEHHSQVKQYSIDAEILLTDNDYSHHLVQQITQSLDKNYHVVIKTDSSLQARQAISELSQKLSLNRTALGEQISQKLAEITHRILQQQNYQFSALFLTGGDMAISVANTLGVSHYRIQGEIEHGVPYGHFPNTSIEHIPVITKAGGFGSEQLLQKVIDFIES